MMDFIFRMILLEVELVGVVYKAVEDSVSHGRISEVPYRLPLAVGW